MGRSSAAGGDEGFGQYPLFPAQLHADECTQCPQECADDKLDQKERVDAESAADRRKQEHGQDRRNDARRHSLEERALAVDADRGHEERPHALDDPVDGNDGAVRRYVRPDKDGGKRRGDEIEKRCKQRGDQHLFRRTQPCIMHKKTPASVIFYGMRGMSSLFLFLARLVRTLGLSGRFGLLFRLCLGGSFALLALGGSLRFLLRLALCLRFLACDLRGALGIRLRDEFLIHLDIGLAGIFAARLDDDGVVVADLHDDAADTARRLDLMSGTDGFQLFYVLLLARLVLPAGQKHEGDKDDDDRDDDDKHDGRRRIAAFSARTRR